MPKLTKNYIDKITAPADKEAFHWDTEIKGFGLRVTPTGKITYIVQGRVNGSSARMVFSQWIRPARWPANICAACAWASTPAPSPRRKQPSA